MLQITNESLLPVMVFIYGGRFMFGDALPNKYGAQYFMDKDVILITFHYRVGILGKTDNYELISNSVRIRKCFRIWIHARLNFAGFLSTEDDAIPGNYGLKDGVAVLRWVQKYIDDFGGDKNRVTLFGGSSGGISVSLTLLSPLAKGIYLRPAY